MIDVSIITHLPILIYTQTQAYFYDVDLKNKYEALIYRNIKWVLHNLFTFTTVLRFDEKDRYILGLLIFVQYMVEAFRTSYRK